MAPGARCIYHTTHPHFNGCRVGFFAEDGLAETDDEFEFEVEVEAVPATMDAAVGFFVVSGVGEGKSVLLLIGVLGWAFFLAAAANENGFGGMILGVGVWGLLEVVCNVTEWDGMGWEDGCRCRCRCNECNAMNVNECQLSNC